MDLSIVLPVYNVEPYLRECLDSILKNDIVEFEVVAVNDGSSDNSLNILEEYSSKYKNIKIISQINRGLSVARNVGLENSLGEYIYFFDSDDILTENICLFNWIKDINEVDIITFNAEVFEEDISRGVKGVNTYKEHNLAGNRNEINNISFVSYTGEEYFHIIKNKKQYSPVVWRRIYKKSFLTDNNILFFPGLIPAEDDLHFFQTLFLNPNIIHVERDVLLHRIRTTSIMSNLSRNRSYKSFNIILVELLKMKQNCTHGITQQKNIDWIINIFLRRIHTQNPKWKELKRLWKISQEYKVKMNWRTPTKFLFNLMRNYKYE
ncbi:glycosyltransferase [Priestia megaterium]